MFIEYNNSNLEKKFLMNNNYQRFEIKKKNKIKNTIKLWKISFRQ